MFRVVSRKSLKLKQFSSLRRSITNGPPLVLQVWGANTGVGKTILSAALLRHTTSPSLYVKPVQSGYPADDDALLVQTYAPNTNSSILHALEAAVSPDLAAELSGSPPISDDTIKGRMGHHLTAFLKDKESALAVVETAGGVLSPVPSGNLQADLYREFRLPALLVGDSALGGIGITLGAYEALKIRGYDVIAIVFFEDDGGLENEAAVERHVAQDGTAVFRAPSIPPKDVTLDRYFAEEDVKLFFERLEGYSRKSEDRRFQKLREMKKEAKEIFWFPFTQHTQLKDVTCIDSAYGNDFCCYDPERGLYPMTDAIGSWWTNGVGHGNPQIAKAVGNACGRYGHVMFAEATYEPAFDLARMLLGGVGKDWASRVFYSDDGSTAVEVALKMAFRKRAVHFPQHLGRPVQIVGVEGCYHGDTLGVMDCAPRSDFNVSQTPWYESRGVFFEPPTAAMKNGVWKLKAPKWTGLNRDVKMSSLEELFDNNRLVTTYNEYISKHLDDVLQNGIELGACLIEPVLLGAGGMQLVDPAFQRALVNECRTRGIPIIYDEVFTGLWRLGVESAIELLGEKPDIGVYGKLLTGGVVPIAVTLASEDVFRSFDGDSKLSALLHGHSYTGHAIGCAAGVDALKQYEGKVENRTYWDSGMVAELSSLELIEQAISIGTLFAFTVKGGGGYAATAAKSLVERLKSEDIFVRPLGNTIYAMCHPLTEKSYCDEVLGRIFRILTEEKRVAENLA